MTGAQHYFGAQPHPALFGAGCPEDWGQDDLMTEDEAQQLYDHVQAEVAADHINRPKRVKFSLIDGEVTRVEY